MWKGSTRATGYTWWNSFMANPSPGRPALFCALLSVTISQSLGSQRSLWAVETWRRQLYAEVEKKEGGCAGRHAVAKSTCLGFLHSRGWSARMCRASIFRTPIVHSEMLQLLKATYACDANRIAFSVWGWLTLYPDIHMDRVLSVPAAVSHSTSASYTQCAVVWTRKNALVLLVVTDFYCSGPAASEMGVLMIMQPWPRVCALNFCWMSCHNSEK